MRWQARTTEEWFLPMNRPISGKLICVWRRARNIATIRAAVDTGVEVAALDRETFTRLIAESEPTKEEIVHVAQERIVENRASRSEVRDVARGGGHSAI